MYKNNNKLVKYLISVISIFYLATNQTIIAKTFTLPSNGSDIVGNVYKITQSQLKPEDNFLTISERYGIGFHELEEANPSTHAWSPYGDIVIPSRYILPEYRNGIVINLAELRLYYFPENSNVVHTFPVGIGKKNWSTPTATTSVISKVNNPTWTVPDSVKQEYKERGEKINDYIRPGPDNPLGKHAMKLGLAGYLIHGTNTDVGVGLRVSHGCIRMMNKDIKKLFNIVPVGTPVRIINEPYKIGTDGQKIYLEAHKPLSEDDINSDYSRNLIEKRLRNLNVGYSINWNTTEYTATEFRGIPVPIGNVRYGSSQLNRYR